MGSTARAVDNIEDFKSALFGRIQSLSKTHLLLADDPRAVNFDHILRSELDAFDDGSKARVVLSGPEVPLGSQVAVSLGMAIHELTTNAAKFGALSVFGGKVKVTWSVTIDATRRTLAFDWVESGGPPVAQPLRQGFGSRLLAFVLPGQIQAKTRIDYAPEGIRIHCVLPLPLPAGTPA
jgi:two-component sensor histidine kinase